MADTEMIHAILQGELVLMVNATRSLYDLHRVTGPFATEFTAALNDAKQWNSASVFASGDEAGAQTQVNLARSRLVPLLHNGYYGILAVPADDLSDADRQEALVSYGWEGGILGDLALVERIESLAGLAVSAGPQVVVAARYSAAVVNRINNWLGVLTANKAIANGGSRVAVNDTKDKKRDTLLVKLGRVRYLYCFASDDGEGNPELERIGFQRKTQAGRRCAATAARCPRRGHLGCRRAHTRRAGHAGPRDLFNSLAPAARRPVGGGRGEQYE